MANTISEEKTILFYFLKYNYSMREIDKILGFDPKKSKGWESWDILNKYHIKKEMANYKTCSGCGNPPMYCTCF